MALNASDLSVVNSWSVGGIVDNVEDGDLGATPAVFTPSASSGCQTTLVAAQHKAGVMFVMAANNMSLLSHYQLAAPTSSGQFITTATYNSALNLLYVTSPSDVAASASFHAAWHGLVAMSVQRDCSLKIEWNVTLGIPWSASDRNSNAPYTNPTLASGVVYFGDGLHKTLHAVNAHTGV